MNLLKFSLLLSLLTFTSFLFAQEIMVNEPPVVQEMMQKYEENNRNEEKVKGWRIQIVTTDDRRKSEKAKSKFGYLYPSMPVYWEHKSPYYVVRVGAYERKVDLMHFLLELKKDFPASTPVMADIPKTDLIR